VATCMSKGPLTIEPVRRLWDAWPQASPHFSPRGETKCVRGLSVRGARRLESCLSARSDVSKLRAAGGNPRSTVRQIPSLTPRLRAGLWSFYILRTTRQGRYNDSPRLQPWGMV